MGDHTFCINCNKQEIKAKGMCQVCYRKDYNNKNRSRINTLCRERAAANKNKLKIYVRTPKVKFQNLKSSAKSRKLTFNLTEQEYFELMRKPCHYCEGFFSLPEAGGGLDRLNNLLGYHWDNVVTCCSICNLTRNANWTPEEAKIMIQAGINFRKIGKNEPTI